MRIVEVTWEDAQSSLDIYTIEELKKIPTITTKSCGYLIDKNEERIILGFMVFDNLIKHHQIIPMAMVRTIKEIRK